MQFEYLANGALETLCLCTQDHCARKHVTGFVLVIVDSGREQQFPPGDGVRVVVVEAGGQAEACGLTANLLAPEVVQRFPQSLFQSHGQLTSLSAGGAQHCVTP